MMELKLTKMAYQSPETAMEIDSVAVLTCMNFKEVKTMFLYYSYKSLIEIVMEMKNNNLRMLNKYLINKCS